MAISAMVGQVSLDCWSFVTDMLVSSGLEATIFMGILGELPIPEETTCVAKASFPKGNIYTALPAAMRYILKAESYDRRGARGKSYCIIAGSAVSRCCL
jgi:hypothetical protein